MTGFSLPREALSVLLGKLFPPDLSRENNAFSKVEGLGQLHGLGFRVSDV